MIQTVQTIADDDRELAQRAGEGDHAAFARLFERYRAGIFRFCDFMLGNSAAAEDIYQDIFIGFYRACRAGNEMTNVRGYLIAAARARCINALKLAGRRTPIDELPEQAIPFDEHAHDRATHLREALQAIAPQYREAFLLFELEGYSYQEISSQLEITTAVVKNRIYRAKQALQRILRPLLGEDGGEY